MAKVSGLRAAAAATPLVGETVEANGVEVFISPVSIAQLLCMAADFEALEALLVRLVGGESPNEGDFMSALLKDGGQGAAALIVMAAGEGRSNELREALLKFPDDAFQRLLEATVRLTAPHGIQELFERAIRFFSVMQGRAPDAEQVAEAA